jgi:hypothetical protein
MMRSAFLLSAIIGAWSVLPAAAHFDTTTTTAKTTTTSTTLPKPTTTTSLKPTTTTSTTSSTTETTTSSTTTSTTLLGGCRVTGGGIVDVTFPPVVDATHGGQVGAPLGVVTAFSPNTPCIQGEWQHVRHDQPRVFGNFHSDTFDSLLCGCLPCSDNPESPGMVGDLCNPGDRICGPEPRRAPANKICFTGVGDFTATNGSKNPRSVAFRVDVEDRSEPGGGGGPPPPDRYRIRMWDLSGDADGAANLVLREQISCGESLAEEPLPAPAPDIDDGGELAKGNHQIHPEINHKDCP